MKKILAISDLHCGHKTGLTHPDWHIEKQSPLKKIQSELWDTYRTMIKPYVGCDCLLILGDCIDGKGGKSGGTELLTTDRYEQCQMAEKAIAEINAKHIVMVYGTPYHTGDEEDFEGSIARHVGAKIGGHEWVDIDGVIFDLKHKIGGSTIPHGRHTAIAKEALWNMLWSEKDVSPKSDIILRGHVHYHAGAFGSDWMGMTMPALHGLGSKYGIRQCSGTVDFGIVGFQTDKGKFTWQKDIRIIKSQASKIIKI